MKARVLTVALIVIALLSVTTVNAFAAFAPPRITKQRVIMNPHVGEYKNKLHRKVANPHVGEYRIKAS